MDKDTIDQVIQKHIKALLENHPDTSIPDFTSALTTAAEELRELGVLA